jgi:hypothetical protein
MLDCAAKSAIQCFAVHKLTVEKISFIVMLFHQSFLRDMLTVEEPARLPSTNIGLDGIE